jgi:ribosomal protein S18 acetylase RimI-like enzyme
MPQVRRQDLPPALLRHLLDRIQQRQVDARQLELLAAWLDSEPEVPEGAWYRRFSGMTVCGEGDLVKTFLTPDQSPKGTPVK